MNPNSDFPSSVARNLEFEFQPNSHLIPEPENSIDLNVAIPSASYNGNSVETRSSSDEISSIIKIGNDVGFQIEEINVDILEDVLDMVAGEEGVNHTSK